jgi:valyl-tRNA synthetase
MWEEKLMANSQQPMANSQEPSLFATIWFSNRLNQVKAELEEMYKQFRLSEALKTVYSLIWDDFCSWYLEWVKPGYEQPIDKGVYDKTVEFYSELMELLHPFMPFITEEIYHQLKERDDDICVKQLSKSSSPDKNILQQGDLLKQTISAIRDARVKNQLKPKESIRLHIQSTGQNGFASIENILARQINAEKISYVNEAVNNTITVVVGTTKFYIASEQELDTSSQKEQLQKELDYHRGFLISVEKKLSNERFVQNAKPEVVEIERKKKADAEQKIRAIEEGLRGLG